MIEISSLFATPCGNPTTSTIRRCWLSPGGAGSFNLSRTIHVKEHAPAAPVQRVVRRPRTKHVRTQSNSSPIQCVIGANPLTLILPRSQVFLSPPHSKESNSPFAFVSSIVRCGLTSSMNTYLAFESHFEINLCLSGFIRLATTKNIFLRCVHSSIVYRFVDSERLVRRGLVSVKEFKRYRARSRSRS